MIIYLQRRHCLHFLMEESLMEECLMEEGLVEEEVLVLVYHLPQIGTHKTSMKGLKNVGKKLDFI